MTKIISFLLAIVTAFGSFGSSLATEALRAFDLQLGLSLCDHSEFLNELTDRDVSQFDDTTGYVKNTLLVFFDAKADLFDRIKAVGQSGGVAVGSLRAARLYVLRTKNCSYEQLTEKAEALTALPGVAFASICPARYVEPQYTPNDPFSDDPEIMQSLWTESHPSGNNWNMEAVNARRAWGYNAYYQNINIGVVDAGFQLDHPELEGLIRFPSAWLEARNLPEDHGSHVCGIIAARGGNGQGVCGLCQNCELTCVDWSYLENSWINDVLVFFGLGHAVKAGAKVINFSVGGSGGIEKDAYQYPYTSVSLSAKLYSCYMSALLFSGYDFICVQSAGNGNEEGFAVDAINNTMFCSITKQNAFTPFPGVSAQDVLDRVIVVGSARLVLDEYVQAASSNVGDQVSVCAPGANIFSCVTQSGYDFMSGTSMAAPHVTAIAAMVWSVNPALSAGEVKRIVCTGTKDTVKITTNPHFQDKGVKFKEYPMVNAALAVEAALKTVGGVSTVLPFVADADSTVELKDQKGRTFEFEADENGTTSVVLLPGTYTATFETLRMPRSATFVVG